MKIMKATSTGLMLLLAGLAFSAAHASPVTLTYTSNNITPSNVSGTISGTGTVDGLRNVLAGQFTLYANGDSEWFDNGDSVQAYCVETGVRITQNHEVTYTVETAEDYFSHRFPYVQQLFANHYHSSNKAAFQLALWEIVNEQGNEQGTEFSLGTGTFKAEGFGSSLATANTWLQAPSGAPVETDFNLYVLRNNDSQDLIFKSVAVPEPGALGLLGAGMLAMMLLMQRRRGLST